MSDHYPTDPHHAASDHHSIEDAQSIELKLKERNALDDKAMRNFNQGVRTFLHSPLYFIRGLFSSGRVSHNTTSISNANPPRPRDS